MRSLRPHFLGKAPTGIRKHDSQLPGRMWGARAADHGAPWCRDLRRRTLSRTCEIAVVPGRYGGTRGFQRAIDTLASVRSRSLPWSGRGREERRLFRTGSQGRRREKQRRRGGHGRSTSRSSEGPLSRNRRLLSVRVARDGPCEVGAPRGYAYAASTAARNAENSGGSGTLNSRRSPVTGCVKPSRNAWRKKRDTVTVRARSPFPRTIFRGLP